MAAARRCSRDGFNKANDIEMELARKKQVCIHIKSHGEEKKNVNSSTKNHNNAQEMGKA